MKVIGYTKISDKFLTTIPKDVREFLKLDIGGRLVWIQQNGQVYIKKA